MRPIEAVLPLTVSIVGFFILFLIIRLFCRDWTRAGMLTSLASVLFFSYGHVLGFLKDSHGFGARLASNYLLVPLWAAILLAVGYFILRYGKTAYKLNQLLNFVSGFLVLTTCIQLFSSYNSQINIKLNHNLTALQDKNAFDPSRVTDRKNLPDVYLIVLDMYDRQDALLQRMNYDNGPFLQELKDIGFVIPDCTQANYGETIYAMSAYLNMNYIDAFYKMNQKDVTEDYPPLTDFIRHSLVRKNFESLGYKTISFETDHNFVEIPDADIFLTRTSGQTVIEKIFDETEFHQILMDTTFLRIFPSLEDNLPLLKNNKNLIDNLLAKINTIADGSGASAHNEKYDQIMTALYNLQAVPEISGHKFVYLHLSSPHPPWVFGPDGSFRIEEGVIPGYTDAVTYLNKRLPDILRKIISQSSVPPVIILQGDHGYGDANLPYRLRNLNAYYLPGDGKKLVYPSITPVNSFRLIFNAYFGGKYAMLEDKSYFLQSGNHNNLILDPPSCIH